MEYSRNVKKLRELLHITQNDLAKQLNVDYSTVSRIERELFNPSYEFTKRFDNFCKENHINFDDAIVVPFDGINTDNIYNDIEQIVHSAYDYANSSVNYILIKRNWYIGKRIREEIFTTKEKDYGKELIKKLAETLTKKYGNGFEQRNLYYYVEFNKKFSDILYTVEANSLLSWSHYRVLLQVEDSFERDWYAKEANDEAWSVRTLQRNISSQYYTRMLSTNYKDAVHEEMINLNKGNQITASQFIKDPMVLEFLGLSEDNKYLESDLEKAIITHLQSFLVELGKGYAFVARQQRIHTEKEDYFIDLVFYNFILKCFVLIDLKTSKITYQDVGQMDMYIKMYDEIKKDSTDNPTIGIVLTSDTDEDIARYSVLHGNEQLFASKYKLYLPSEEELRKEIDRQKLLFEYKNK